MEEAIFTRGLFGEGALLMIWLLRKSLSAGERAEQGKVEPRSSLEIKIYDKTEKFGLSGADFYSCTVSF